ncbi:MAG TPA: hypothetical protein VFD57_07340 [Clostridia bacterium]|nr:hypothetical protein [Clostridia bacterium]
MKEEKGIYRWTYEMNMWTNPTIIITLAKVLLLGAAVPILFVTLLALFEQGLGEAIEAFTAVSIPVVLIIGVLFAIAYPIVGIINGGKYCVVFEMDEKGVKHIQMQKQFKKAQVLGMITALVGTNPTTTGIGLLAASKSSSYSEFSKVKSIIAKKSRGLIYLNENLERNQVYVAKEDFDYVLDYLLNHCPKAKVRVK